MINKFNHLTELEKADWSTTYFAIHALQMEIETSINRLKGSVKQSFKEVE